MGTCMSTKATIDRINTVCDDLGKLSNLFANGTNESWCCGIGKNLLLEYKAVLESKKEEQKFRIGDYVKIRDKGKLYPAYEDFLPRVAPEYARNYIPEGKPIRGEIFEIVATGEHENPCYGTVFAIQDRATRQVFLISEEGLEAAK